MAFLSKKIKKPVKNKLGAMGHYEGQGCINLASQADFGVEAPRLIKRRASVKVKKGKYK